MYLQRNTEQNFIINLGDVKFTFGKLGINKITHPVSLSHSTAHNVNTDWIAPYQAGTVTNGIPDNNHAAVGGNHGTDGSGGYATANSENTSIIIDGFEVPQDSKRYPFERVEMSTVNLITAKANINLANGDRLRNDFKETVKYTFENNHMQIEVELEALEDFYINWYVGLQLTRDGWKKDAYFNHDLVQTQLYNQTTSRLDSGTKLGSPDLERVTLRNDKSDIVHVYIDKDYGVGFSKIRDTDPVLYLREDFLKMYFHLIKNDNPLTILKGTKIAFRGGYIFGKNKAINATSVTYFTENGIKKAFVDFKLLATEPIEYTSVEESWNCTFGADTITSNSASAYAKVVI